MHQTLNISSKDQLRWPSKCAVCGAHPVDTALASFKKITGFAYYIIAFSIKYDRYSIPYPVCPKHKLLCRLSDIPARCSLLDYIGLFVLFPIVMAFIVLFIMSAIWGIKGGEYLNNIIFSFVGLMAIFFIFSAIFKPVKVIQAKEGTITLFIRRIDLFRELQYVTTDVTYEDTETSMKLIIDCPECKQKLKVSNSSESLKIKCPTCSSIFIWENQHN